MGRHIVDYQEYVTGRKNYIIAPAGCGKTYSIAESLNHTEGKQLILTHTHSGVAALKEKIRNKDIPSKDFRVETITSFAQKYVNAFYCEDDIPNQEETNDYYPFIVEKAKELVIITPIKDVIEATYGGLFVDEYQDCTIEQHQLIIALSEILPTHLVGDPLQGIFDFNNQQLVDFDTDLSSFEKFTELSEPWRWKDINCGLGECLQDIRERLLANKKIDLASYKQNIEVVHINEQEKYISGKTYNSRLWKLMKEDRILFIDSDSANFQRRKYFISRFNNAARLLEAIDQEDFYKLSRKLDKLNRENFYVTLHDIVPVLFNGTSSRNAWFNTKGPKKKNKPEENILLLPIRQILECLQSKISFLKVSLFLNVVSKLPKIKCYRRELFSNLCEALKRAEYEKISVYDAMCKLRNIKRRNGRKILGRSIGTTLLTKGLEFETVAVLDAHHFKCPKNFYVAMTRASKKLVVFTENMMLSPYMGL